MNRLFLSAVLFAVVILGCFASDETYRKGIPGSYSRALGMEATTIELRRDGTYVLTIQGCLASEEGKGLWSVKDETLILDGRGHPKGRKDKLTKFEIVVLNDDLALRPLDDQIDSTDRDTDFLFFKPMKKEANQALQPTALLGRG